ncbi:hypothetical protein [Jeotgalibaca porci]|uniref:hypothetical protein n=2 Tax=Jeotgalibaca porci TaxID=1868793 RepID=UPI00359F3A96
MTDSKRNLFLIVSLCFLGLFLNINSETIQAAETFDQENISVAEEVEPDVPVRRIWIEGYVVPFIGPKASPTYYYDLRGFAGYLTLIHEDVQMGGTTGTYQGYAYNKNYPIPSPSKALKIDLDLFQETMSSSSDSKKITVSRTDLIYNLPAEINYNDGTYRGTLFLQEYWGNKDGTFTATYTGTVYKGARPIPASILVEE